jgi:pimeloyl-ACP methyl ester carboxylesterase
VPATCQYGAEVGDSERKPDDGLTIAYRVSGQGRPLVLIHGFTVTSTTNFATYYAYDSGGQLVASAGPTVESALLDAGFQAVMHDLRGHGHSAKPHDPARYSMDAHVGDVQALVSRLSLDRPALAGYSFGSMFAGRLLALPWVSAAALSGTGSFHVEGEEDPDPEGSWDDLARCFSEGLWDQHPGWGSCAAWPNSAAITISPPSARSPRASNRSRRPASAPRPCPNWS